MKYLLCIVHVRTLLQCNEVSTFRDFWEFNFACPPLTIIILKLVLLRNFEKLGLDYLKKVKPMLSDLNTYLSKVGVKHFINVTV